ncbi:T9SS type A sorting domain-containing protein, partial [Aureisphaera sp.]
DGLGTYGSAIIVSNSVLGVQTAMAVDIDGDLDADIVCTSDEDDTIAWFENTDGMGTFGPKTIITTGVSGRDSFVGDIDGDDDMDILTSANGIGKTLSWFENVDGQGTFSGEIIIANNDSGVEEVFLADLDGDDDLDALFVTPAQDLVAWHENLDGQGNFGPEQIISNSAGFVRTLYAADLDNDNDMDVVSGSSDFEGNISWYENLDGNGSFGPPQQIEGKEAGGIRSVFAADLDGDSDNDVLGALLREDKVVWYRNSTIAGLDDLAFNEFSVYPNPVGDLLHFDTKGNAIERIMVYDVSGRLLLAIADAVYRINMAALPSGILFVEIFTAGGSGVFKIIKE